MSENSNIEWTDHTFNPWEGCAKVSAGCANCYAEARNYRFNGGESPNWGKGKPRRLTSPANWAKPLRWNREGYEAGVRPKVFCASLADWLDEDVPIEWLTDLVILILSTPFLDWQLLTKRPQNFDSRMLEVYEQLASRGMVTEWFEVGAWISDEAPRNVSLGVSVEDQSQAEKRIPELIELPATSRFLSCEPLLGPLDLSYCLNEPIIPCLDWVIVGGESGRGARPFEADWARRIRDDCMASQVAFFMKQMGGPRKPFAPIPDDLMIREFPG